MRLYCTWFEFLSSLVSCHSKVILIYMSTRLIWVETLYLSTFEMLACMSHIMHDSDISIHSGTTPWLICNVGREANQQPKDRKV